MLRACVRACVCDSAVHSVHSCVGSREDEEGKAPDAAADASSLTRLL